MTKCEPAFQLLIQSGFRKSANNKRLIWTNDNNNMISLKHIQNVLKSMVDDTEPITGNVTSKQQPMNQQSHQSNHQITQMITDLISNQSPV